MIALVIVIVSIPIVIYLVGTLRGSHRITDADRFFLLPDQITAGEFANSSVAYSFQIATTSVFLVWGYFYGLGAMVSGVFWGVGILLLAAMVPHLAGFLGSRRTLPGFLGERYGSGALRSLASAMVLIAYLGFMLAELVWGSVVLNAIHPSPWFMYFVTFAMGILVLIYLCRGGHQSVIGSDQWQLLIIYLGILATTLGLLFFVRSEEETVNATAFMISLFLLVLLAVVLRNVRGATGGAFSTSSSLPQKLLVVTVAGAVVTCAVLVFLRLDSAPAAGRAIAEGKLFHFGQSPWDYLSLVVVNTVWQLTDVATWQRLGAVKVSRAGGVKDLTPIRKGLLRFAVESPVSWFIAIALGMTLRYVELGFNDETIWGFLGALPANLMADPPFLPEIGGALLAALFMVAIVAAMLSTVDSFLMAGTFVFIYDFLPPTRRLAEGRQDEATGRRLIRAGQFSAVFIIVAGLAGYFALSRLGAGEEVLAVLFGASAGQVSLFPVVMGTLLLKDRAPAARWSVVAVSVGFLGGMYAMWRGLSDPSFAVLPPLFGVALSTPIYCLGALLAARRRRGESLTVNG